MKKIFAAFFVLTLAPGLSCSQRSSDGSLSDQPAHVSDRPAERDPNSSLSKSDCDDQANAGDEIRSDCQEYDKTRNTEATR